MTPRAVHLILIVFVLATGVTGAASAQSGWALDQTDDCTLPAVAHGRRDASTCGDQASRAVPSSSQIDEP